MTKAIDMPPEWWTERRKRDYYIDESGELCVVGGSETDQKIRSALVGDAIAFAAKEYDAGRVERVPLSRMN